MLKTTGRAMDRLSGQRATSRGTTLVELLLVTTLIALTLRIATPSLVALRAEIDTQVAVSRVSHSLANAKITALNSAAIVTLCGSLDGIQCGRHWSDGLLTFIDSDGDRRMGGDDELIHWQPMDDLLGALSWRAFGSRHYLLLDSRGGLQTNNGSFTYCPPPPARSPAAKIVINRSARSRIEWRSSTAQCD